MKLKYFILLLLITSFVVTAIFSFMIFDHQMNHSNSGCLAYTVNGLICPLKVIEFSKTLAAPIFKLLLMLVFLAFVPILLFILFLNRLAFKKFNVTYHQRQFIRWLSLLEHSPSV